MWMIKDPEPHTQLGGAALEMGPERPRLSLFPQHTRTPEPERERERDAFLCSSYSKWEDMVQQKPRLSVSQAAGAPIRPSTHCA